MFDEVLEIAEGILRFILTIPGIIISVITIIILSVVGGALLNVAFEVLRTAFEGNSIAQESVTAAQTTTEVIGIFDDSKAIYKVIIPSIVTIAGFFGFKLGILREGWHIIPIGAIAILLFIFL